MRANGYKNAGAYLRASRPRTPRPRETGCKRGEKSGENPAEEEEKRRTLGRADICAYVRGYLCTYPPAA